MDQLIKYETAKLAKEKGFDAKTLYYYTTDFSSFKADGIAKKWLADEDNSYWNIRKAGSNQFHLLNCPTQSSLQTWLRDELKWSIEIYFKPYLSHDPRRYQFFMWYRGEEVEVDIFKTYEEGLERCLFLGLNLI